MPVTKLCRNNTMFIKKTRLGLGLGVRVGVGLGFRVRVRFRVG